MAGSAVRRRPAAIARLVRLLLALVAAVLLAQMVAAAPAAAHAELVDTSPGNGERLTRPPTEVVLRFTEGVGLVEDGMELLDAEGEAVPTAEDPEVDGALVRWPLPDGLPSDSYLVSWRVVSKDGHPISGAFSFGVGEDAAPVTEASGATGIAWPVTTARFAGYLGFALAAGAVVLLIACWPQGRSQPAPRRLMRAGFALVGLAGLVAFLLQGPYAAGAPFTRLFDRELIATTGNSEFGAWTQVRVLLCLALAGILWSPTSLGDRSHRWIGGVGVALLAVTFTGTGHAVTDPVWSRAVDAVHVLAAGTWVGGLVVLATASVGPPAAERPGLAIVARFSKLAFASVVLLVLTGTLNSLSRLGSVDQLWSTGYGRILAVKIALVAVVVALAAVSRRRVHAGTAPSRTVLAEAVATVVVLAVTAVLASVTPPPTTDPAGAGGVAEGATSVELQLTDGATAKLRVTEDERPGRLVQLELVTAEGDELGARRVEVSATLESEELGPVQVPVRQRGSGWVGRFDPPLPGMWTFTVTVESPDRTAVVTSGQVRLD